MKSNFLTVAGLFYFFVLIERYLQGGSGGLYPKYGTLKARNSPVGFLQKRLDRTDARPYNIGMLFVTLLLSLAQTTAYDAIVSKDGVVCANQFQDAIIVNIRPECRAMLAPIVASIRHAENGGKGREYGILHPRVKPTYRSQAGWCASTVQKHYDRWVKGGRVGEFIVSLGARYCPIGADNDPTGLNKHWIKNVKYYLTRCGGTAII